MKTVTIKQIAASCATTQGTEKWGGSQARIGVEQIGECAPWSALCNRYGKDTCVSETRASGVTRDCYVALLASCLELL